ncbi:MAG: glycosyltransferase family 10 [Planctomycetota bacterium]
MAPVNATLGLVVERGSANRLLWNQTEGLEGVHRTPEGVFRVQAGWEGADHLLVFGTPIPEDGGVRPTRAQRWARKIGFVSEHDDIRRRCDLAWRRLLDQSGLERERVSCLFYEPPSLVSDAAYLSAHAHAGRVFGPDDRAGVCTRLPAMWTLGESVRSLRTTPMPAKTMRLVCVTSGKAMTPGHEARLRFLRLLRDRGVPFDLFGRDLPSDLEGRGEISDKADVFDSAAFALVLENDASGRHYVTEKLWDALVCWCAPIYWGSRAADRMIPGESMIRLPDLEEGGVDTIVRALADPESYSSRVGAIEEARTRTLGDLRMVEWARHKLMGFRRMSSIQGAGAWGLDEDASGPTGAGERSA